MKISYRPEIDGLRTIAVVAVVLYHAQITILGQQPFKGGFIGVDIFFVISGYLITSIILKELINTGSFSFKHFYERRIRRILPALLVVMLASIPFAWMYLIPTSFIDFSKSIFYSLGFSSNFYFHYSGQIYAAVSGLLKPFLHTWSLSVEEQFYIIFPITLVIILKYSKKYLIHILFFGFVISLGLAEWTSRNYPSISFYFLHTRMWDLLAGSILAYFEITFGHRSKNKTLNIILPKVGFLLIILTIIFFKLYFSHPSLYTLIPIIGVCLIIWFSEKDELITKILSTKIFVGIGLISYSLYLWHFPIFAFARIKNLTHTHFDKFLLILLSVILSVFTYYLIEQPFRKRKVKFKQIASIILCFISILVIFNFTSINKDGFKHRLPVILQDNLKQVSSDLKNDDGEVCHNNIELCKFNISSNQKVFIIGDSHVASLLFNLKDRMIKNKYQFVSSTFSGCIYLPGFNLTTNSGKIDKKCNDKYFQSLKKILSEEENSIIIFGGRLPFYLTNYMFDNKEGGSEIGLTGRDGKWGMQYIPAGKYNTIQNSYKEEILKLSNKNKIILVYPIPEVGWDVNSKIFVNRNNKFSLKSNLENLEYVTTSYEVFKERNKSSFDLLNSIQNSNIYRVYPHNLFCNTKISDRCITHNDENIFYIDDDHVSAKGAEMINNLIVDKIKEIELKKSDN
jgi:peptidoglycan/LPS O-acetylase OafA/YrhL